MRLIDPLRWVKIRRGQYVADAGRHGKYHVRRSSRWYAYENDTLLTDPPGRVLRIDATIDAIGSHRYSIATSPETVGEHIFAAVFYQPALGPHALAWAYAGNLDSILGTKGETPVGLAIRAYLDLTEPAPTSPHVRGLIADALAEPRLIPILRDALEDAGSPLLAAIDQIADFLATYG